MVTSPVVTFRSSTVLFFGSIQIASQLIRASIPNITLNVCTFDTSRLDSFGMTPEM